MSPNVKQIAIVIAVVAALLGGYEYYLRGVREQARAEAEALRRQAEELGRQTRIQTEELARQAQELKSQTEAMRDEVKSEHAAAAEQQQFARLAGYRAEGLHAAAAAKVAVAEFMMTNGKLPASNAAVGLAAPEQFSGASLRRLEVSDGGVITLTYDEKSGVAGGRIRLIPDAGNLAMGLRWRCVSPDFSDIAASVPQCEYKPSGS